MRIEMGRPQPRQAEFIKDRHKVTAFGGARGGGKSWSLRFLAKLLCLKYAGYRVGIVRTTYPELQKNHIEPLKAECVATGIATYNDGRKEMRFKNGSIIYFLYCQVDKDIDKFSGIELHALFVDEATHIKEEHLKKMGACVRSTDDYPKMIRYTCNPDGVSMPFVKRLFVDCKYEDGENPEDFHFIQSLLSDNEILMANDPSYQKYLESLPPKLREAWLNGRWDIYSGMYWSEWRDSPDAFLCNEAGISVEEARQQHRWTHVIPAFKIPPNWTIVRGYDFGYAKPFSFGYWALSPENVMYRFLEWYGCTKTPNEGVRMTPKQQFEYVRQLEESHPLLRGKYIQGVADPSIWDGSRGVAIVEEAEKEHIFFDRGVNDRIAGWMQVRERLKFDKNGYAMMYVFDTCEQFIRTMPLQMHDEKRPEDLCTDNEDHICDEMRYVCMRHQILPRIIEGEFAPMSDPLNQYTKQQGTWSAYNQIARR